MLVAAMGYVGAIILPNLRHTGRLKGSRNSLETP
jgi:hypothetical protein